jgi:hypothetical protein
MSDKQPDPINPPPPPPMPGQPPPQGPQPADKRPRKNAIKHKPLKGEDLDKAHEEWKDSPTGKGTGGATL